MTASLQALTATTGNKTDCWNTPPEVVAKVQEFFNNKLELDPCCNDKSTPNVQAMRYFDESDDGLSHSWNYVFRAHKQNHANMHISEIFTSC